MNNFSSYSVLLRQGVRLIRARGLRALTGKLLGRATGVAARSDIEILEARISELAQANAVLWRQSVQLAARTAATSGDHRYIPAHESSDEVTLQSPRKLKIGLFDNLANQAYITARALRKLGYDVEVVVQENWADTFAMARPQWEECEIENIDPAKFNDHHVTWKAPEFVRYAPHSYDLHYRYSGKPGAVEEVAALYKASFGRALSDDLAILLTENMAHWDYIKAMGRYDVVVLSMSAVLLGAFSPVPTIICPLGSEVYSRAFDQDVGGLLARAAFRSAAHISVPETDYFAYIDRMGTAAPRTFQPLIVDTEVYAPGEEPHLRADWKAKVGGERFLLGVCRQDWTWKGSDKLIRAFAKLRQTGGADDWRLLLQSWGTDIERSRALVSELGLDDVTLWLPICSKPLLRRRQRAADVVADQFVMEGYGASVLESLAAAKPVIIRQVPLTSAHHFRAGPPPFVGASTVDEIASAMSTLIDDERRERIGRESRAWVEAEHGFRTLGPKYMQMFEQAARFPREAQNAGQGPTSRAASVAADVRSAYEHCRGEMMGKWNRMTSLPDMFTDRWEKAKFLGFGEGASAYDSALVIGDVQVGEKTWIGPGCVLDGSAGLKIGATCSLSAGVQIYSHDTVNWAVSGGTAPYERQSTVVGDHVYFGPNVVVSAGAEIGDCCVVGAFSLVKGKIPPNSFVVGAPARVIGRVEVDEDGSVRIARTDRSQPETGSQR